jgi:hypothetical protein
VVPHPAAPVQGDRAGMCWPDWETYERISRLFGWDSTEHAFGTLTCPTALRWPSNLNVTRIRWRIRSKRKFVADTSDPAAFVTRIGPVPSPEGTRDRRRTAKPGRKIPSTLRFRRPSG